MWDCFWRLHTDRPMGFGGVGAIPNTAIVAAGDRLGMGADEAEWFTSLIVKMDGAFLAWRDKQQPKKH